MAVLVLIGGLLALSCPAALAARSSKTFCQVLRSGNAKLRERAARASAAGDSDPMAELAIALGSVGQFEILLGRLAKAAPASVRPDVEAVAAAWHDTTASVTRGVSDPLGAIATSVLQSMIVSGSVESVDAFAQQHCGMTVFGSSTPSSSTDHGAEVATFSSAIGYEDTDGYTYQVAYSGRLGTPTTSVENLKPGWAAVVVPFDATVSVANTTPRRRAPSIGTAGVAAVFGPDRPACSSLKGSQIAKQLSSGVVPQLPDGSCLLFEAEGELRNPIGVGATATVALEATQSVNDSQLAPKGSAVIYVDDASTDAVARDVERGPDAWIGYGQAADVLADGVNAGADDDCVFDNGGFVSSEAVRVYLLWTAGATSHPSCPGNE